jgi:hypothetical protein
VPCFRFISRIRTRALVFRSQTPSPITPSSQSTIQVFLRDTYGIHKTLSIGHLSDDSTSDFTTYTKSALRVLEKKILQMVDSATLPNEETLDKAILDAFSKYNPDEKLMKVLAAI